MRNKYEGRRNNIRWQKIKIITKLPKNMIEDNKLKIELDNTIELEAVQKEIENVTKG